MTSVVSSFAQIRPDSSHFIALHDDVGTDAVFTPASVAAVVADSGAALVAATLPSGADAVGALFKDLGKTVTAKDASGNPVTFRLVQYVDPNSPATNGITGATYGVGYIMLGLNGATDAVFTNAIVAKVAKYGL